MIYDLFQKIQLKFWDAIIYALDEIKPARHIVQDTYRLIEDGSLRRFTITSLKVALAGLLSGVAFFLIFTIIT